MWFVQICVSLALIAPCQSWCSVPPFSSSWRYIDASGQRIQKRIDFSRRMSDWSDFAYDDGEESINIEFANENDPQEVKAEVGMALDAPTVSSNAEPIFTPQGTVLPLTEENVEGVLAACREEIGTMFGYTAENRGVGITGGVDFVEMDGPVVVLKLKGRFWHKRPTVLARVGAYIMGRIPEVIDVVIDDPYELTDEANNAAA